MKNKARLSFTYERLERFLKEINFLPEDGHITNVDDIPCRGIIYINFESQYGYERAEGAEAVVYPFPAWWVTER